MIKRASILVLLSLTTAQVLATDLSITVGNVMPAASDTVVRVVRAGETLTAGMPVYRNTSDNEYYKCDADASEAAATCAGITISAGSDGTYCTIVTAGRLKIGSTVTVGTQYFASDTAGGIMPGVDLDTGDYLTPIGITTDTDEILVDIVVTGDQK